MSQKDSKGESAAASTTGSSSAKTEPKQVPWKYIQVDERDVKALDLLLFTIGLFEETDTPCGCEISHLVEVTKLKEAEIIRLLFVLDSNGYIYSTISPRHFLVTPSVD